MEELIKCPVCLVNKAKTDYRILFNKKYPDRLISVKYCNDCKKQRQKQQNRKQREIYNRENKEFIIQQRKISYLKHKEKRNNYSKEYNKKHPRTAKNTEKKYKYGITQSQYEQMVINQQNKCAICNNPPISFKPVLYIDHCHTTGKVRGLLCHFCNAGIGMLKDNPDLLRKAITYLETTT